MIADPVNGLQEQYNELCKVGRPAGPDRRRVQDLLLWGGTELNKLAFGETERFLQELPDRNPWYVCFAIGMAWGHLAQLESTFVRAAADVLTEWNGEDLTTAMDYSMDRGPEVIHNTFSGGRRVFEAVRPPADLPDELPRIAAYQHRWFVPISGSHRVPYIGPWNATAMFMACLFAKPRLAHSMTDTAVLLPPNGPVKRALELLYKARLLSKGPTSKEFDDEGAALGTIFDDNSLMRELVPGCAGMNMIDLHSGLYLLGTRYRRSREWV